MQLQPNDFIIFFPRPCANQTFFFFFFKNVPIKDATRSCGQLHKVYEAEPALDGPLKMLFLKLFIQKYDVLNFLTYG